MQRFAIRLAVVVAALLAASQLALPAYLAHRVANRLTAHGGSAHVELGAFPALRLLGGSGDKLKISADRLSVDLEPGQEDVFKRLDDFSHVTIDVRDARAGPFSIGNFRVQKLAAHSYLLAVAGDATAGDVARYAGSQLGGGFGQALAGLAAATLGNFDRPIPFDASMQIQTGAGGPRARDVQGDVAGFPAGPLAQVVANALLSGF